MRECVKDFVSIVASLIRAPEPIYEFGSYLVENQRELANLRPMFPGMNYVGCDMREGPGVDRLLNLHQIELDPSTVGTVLCLDTLEHVEYPRQAMAEIHRILKPDGLVMISSVMNYPIHDHPCDYWRFTPEAFRSLLKDFQHIYVNYAGADDFPHTVVGIGRKGNGIHLDTLSQRGKDWQRQWTEPESPKTVTEKIKRESMRIIKQIASPFRG